MEIDRIKYKVWDKKTFSVVHFMLNPGLAFNELVLGQRVPKITLIDQTSDKPLMERTYVPCPHCESYHDGRTWSSQNNTVFRNWFGLYCHHCGEIIPCIRNWTSALILFTTYPLWFWWIGSWKQSWIRAQPERYSNLTLEGIEHKKVSWIKMGLLWGGLMFVVMSLSMPLIIGAEYDLKLILLTLPIWVIAGLAFGYTLKWLLGKKEKQKLNSRIKEI